jgi:hypothetical protein
MISVEGNEIFHHFTSSLYFLGISPNLFVSELIQIYPLSITN